MSDEIHDPARPPPRSVLDRACADCGRPLPGLSGYLIRRSPTGARYYICRSWRGCQTRQQERNARNVCQPQAPRD